MENIYCSIYIGIHNHVLVDDINSKFTLSDKVWDIRVTVVRDIVAVERVCSACIRFIKINCFDWNIVFLAERFEILYKGFENFVLIKWMIFVTAAEGEIITLAATDINRLNLSGLRNSYRIQSAFQRCWSFCR